MACSVPFILYFIYYWIACFAASIITACMDPTLGIHPIRVDANTYVLPPSSGRESPTHFRSWVFYTGGRPNPSYPFFSDLPILYSFAHPTEPIYYEVDCPIQICPRQAWVRSIGQLHCKGYLDCLRAFIFNFKADELEAAKLVKRWYYKRNRDFPAHQRVVITNSSKIDDDEYYENGIISCDQLMMQQKLRDNDTKRKQIVKERKQSRRIKQKLNIALAVNAGIDRYIHIESIDR